MKMDNHKGATLTTAQDAIQNEFTTIERLSRLCEDLTRRMAILETEVSVIKASKANDTETRDSEMNEVREPKGIATFKVNMKRWTWNHRKMNEKPECPKCKKTFGNDGAAFSHIRKC
ncbi:MAG: hypothetical protein MHMPM18_001162 [Marteilia pararefringens]